VTETDQKALAWGEITDETIADAATLVGTEMRRDQHKWISEINVDAIAHFAEGVGDRNPLWRDVEYGERSQWGTTLAPPSILYAVDSTNVSPRLAGVQWIYAGTDFTWYDVIRLGDVVDSTAKFLKQDVKGGDFARRWVLQTGYVRYVRRSDGALLAEAWGRCARTPRGEALKKEGKTKYEVKQEARYTRERLAQIEKEILAEEARGGEPLYWDDVTNGQEIRPVVKGPLTSTDMIAWYAGWSGARPYGGALGDVVRYRLRHHDYHISEITGAKDSAGRGHVEAKTGSDVGMGGAYDIGPQRLSWCIHMLTDWMGDAGFLHKFSGTLLRPNLIGDTTWWRGTVTGREVVDGYHLAHVECVAVNQDGVSHAKARATIVLPTREDVSIALPIPRDLTSYGETER
jgi:acyl dehydratase